MILTELSLQHFRSYKKQKFSFPPEITLIIGRNTAGKTNILEAVYAMATGKSFRADRENEVITWGYQLSAISCQLANGDALEIRITTGEVAGIKAPQKRYLVNGVPRRQVDFVGNLRAVLFSPEDLDLVTGSPSKRRRYLDSVLMQVDREYRRTLASYERGLRQRNKLLFLISEGRASRSQLAFWDELLIKSGTYVTERRQEFIEFINGYSVSGIVYRVEYDKSVISEARLAQYKDAEAGAKVTLVGPHRDDFVVVKAIREKEIRYKQDDNKDVSLISSRLSLASYGSRGEQRLAVLWLKLAELAYIESQTGVRPILLLDDIFSELDEGHRALVLDVVSKQQTVLTSAEEDVVALLKQRGVNAEIVRLD